jgi:hypothetical protein
MDQRSILIFFFTTVVQSFYVVKSYGLDLLHQLSFSRLSDYLLIIY